MKGLKFIVSMVVGSASFAILFSQFVPISPYTFVVYMVGVVSLFLCGVFYSELE